MTKNKAYKLAELIIQGAIGNKEDFLSLHGMDIDELPESIGQLSQLTDLDLGGNILTSLPESLGELTQLTELDLSLNDLELLPESIGQLTQLKSLVIDAKTIMDQVSF
ncbi:hypothetical protein [Gimesia aquarii]|uniref:Leucine Rich repeats (2 copies) n=1 Tax=Gimesia aquarii TaxID=2527964 RepID=A0A517X0L4_9PLAN|nr:hypothetical protein [Gimesia aquarii]QDU11039.1 Leucine Rich repeats (2 copies) [Gimesia aquarii]